jgi:II/X family phage/plasmid replication protein
LVVEGSVHKAMMGHNVYGGPESFKEPVLWFCDHISRDLGVHLPWPEFWTVRRVDWAEIYGLKYEAIEHYIWSMNNARYPRRKTGRYGQETVNFAGRTTAVNFYHKGPEFSEHDYKRLRGRLDKDLLECLQQTANGIMRVEAQVKAKKLDEDFNGKPSVCQISTEYLRRLHEREVSKLIREGEYEMKTVRDQKDVRDRLYSEHSKKAASSLFGTWMQLATLGEDETRRYMARRTFYLHRKQLQESGVSWLGSDIHRIESVSSLPQDFAPLQADPRRISGESPEVADKLSSYRAA